jgi:hypothetical protein
MRGLVLAIRSFVALAMLPVNFRDPGDQQFPKNIAGPFKCFAHQSFSLAPVALFACTNDLPVVLQSDSKINRPSVAQRAIPLRFLPERTDLSQESRASAS